MEICGQRFHTDRAAYIWVSLDNAQADPTLGGVVVVAAQYLLTIMCYKPAYKTKPIYTQRILFTGLPAGHIHESHEESGMPTGFHREDSFRTKGTREQHHVLF